MVLTTTMLFGVIFVLCAVIFITLMQLLVQTTGFLQSLAYGFVASIGFFGAVIFGALFVFAALM